jgi:hypothetical protein
MKHKLGDEIEILLKAKYNFGPGGGVLHMRFADCVVEIKNDAGETVGEVAGCIGGGIDISIHKPDHHYVWNISAMKLWQALMEALERTETNGGNHEESQIPGDSTGARNGRL